MFLHIHFISALLLLETVWSQYCSSACIDYINTCSSYSFGDCTVCAVSIYSLVPDATGCVLIDQTNIIAKDLTVPVSLSSFTGSSLVPYTCGSYQLSGQYGASDYLQKLYQTSLPHFLLILRFNVAFMGTWGTSDALVISVDGTSTNFNYNCTYSTRECTATDCIRIPQADYNHSGSTALVKFSSTSIQPASIASWGLKDLLVVLKTCNDRCSSCYGPSINQCYTCSTGYFLLGNACVEQCPLLAVPAINLCTISCPNTYYKVAGSMQCQPCSQGCNVCAGPLSSDCIVDAQVESMWDQKKEFWIFLIIFGALLLISAVACLIMKRRANNKVGSLGEPMIKQSHVTEDNIENQPTRLNNNSMIDFGQDDRVKTLRPINDNISDNGSNSHSNSSSEDSGQQRKKRKWRGNESL